LINQSCLEHRLTADERERFSENGYLIIEYALNAVQVEQLTAAADAAFSSSLESGHDPKAALFYPNFIPDNPIFADLVDYERIVPKVWGILGRRAIAGMAEGT
jgi:hypothetical protein